MHLSLCVLDAVFSINARYGGVVRGCHRYADHAGRLLPAADTGQVVGTVREEAVAGFAALGRHVGPERLAGEVVGNRSRTSTRGGIPKADAAICYTEIPSDAGVQRLGDVAVLLATRTFSPRSRARSARVPSHGSSARLSYLRMLAGDDQHIKPDRMVPRWLSNHLRRGVRVPEARTLLPQVVAFPQRADK